MSVEALDRLKEHFAGAVLGTHAHRGDETAIVDSKRVLEVCRFLRDELHFDMLVDLTAVDILGLDPKTVRAIGGSAGRFQVVYHLRSMKTGKRLRIKAELDEGANGESPEIDTVTHLWKSALWAEREVWDMFGIKFHGHPDLRRILMYEEFVGHPLRKDYPKEKRQPLVRRDFT